MTGVLGGVGRACAAAFREAGWVVAGTDRLAPPHEPVCDHFAQIDLTDPGAGEAFSTFVASAGQVDALVNNAGLLVLNDLADTSDATWAAVMSTNVTGAFVAIRAAIPYLKAAHGSVVNVSSVHAVATSAGVAAYASSKGALFALTRAAALELAPFGVRVNAVLPGAIDTAMLHSGAQARRGDDLEDPIGGLARRTPLGRIGRPAEVASVVLFLADGERSSFVTGQGWIVDGGVTARLASE